ncbi:MAG: AraC family transcriptional regulator [Burkholderiaceae bacterium]|nr:MAG: AraC family transcriptional regulator [Burkholderiaceae bacterium]
MLKVLDTTTAGIELEDKLLFWRRAIKSVVYELDITFSSSKEFRGIAENCPLGDVQWTRIKSMPIQYQRHKQHYAGQAPQILLCVPIVGRTEFTQFGRYIHCQQGQFMLEHSNEPYKFSYDKDIDLWAIRIPEDMLRTRVHDPARFCAINFDGRTDMGKFFLDYLDAVVNNIQQVPEQMRSLVGAQLTDLLAVVLEGDKRILNSTSSSIKAAHLARVEQHLREHLSDSGLSAQNVASACGISVRYLHLLFKETNWTFSQWVRERRLQLAYESLHRSTGKVSVAQLAYQLGFNDHAQFSRAFRTRYDCTPSDVLNRYLESH